MRIEEKPFKHWMDHFYGYGSWEAKIWFVGYEEGGGELPEEVAEKLNYFYNVHANSTTPTLCDIRDLYQHVSFRVEGPRAELFDNLHDYRFGKHANPHGLWKNLVAFVHGYRNKKLPDVLTYQRNSFASPTKANECLVQLYPLPSPHNHAWYYAWLDMPQFGFLKTRGMYQEHFYESRIQTILENIRRYKPQLVLMYGMDNINALKQSFQSFFPSVKFKMEKAIKLQFPQYHRADFDGTTVLITTQVPALRHNRVETGFDWLEFGKLIKSGS